MCTHEQTLYICTQYMHTEKSIVQKYFLFVIDNTFNLSTFFMQRAYVDLRA